jgi:hypothetical protein
MSTRLVVAFLLLVLCAPAQAATLSQALDEGEALGQLKAVIVARDGDVLAERGYRGHSVSAATNIKSASKSIVSALVGIAIDKGVLEGVDQPIAPLLASDLPADPDPRLARSDHRQPACRCRPAWSAPRAPARGAFSDVPPGDHLGHRLQHVHQSVDAHRPAVHAAGLRPGAVERQRSDAGGADASGRHPLRALRIPRVRALPHRRPGGAGHRRIPARARVRRGRLSRRAPGPEVRNQPLQDLQSPASFSRAPGRSRCSTCRGRRSISASSISCTRCSASSRPSPWCCW